MCTGTTEFETIESEQKKTGIWAFALSSDNNVIKRRHFYVLEN